MFISPVVNNEVLQHVLKQPNRIFRLNAAEGLMPQVLGVYRASNLGEN